MCKTRVIHRFELQANCQGGAHFLRAIACPVELFQDLQVFEIFLCFSSKDHSVGISRAECVSFKALIFKGNRQLSKVGIAAIDSLQVGNKEGAGIHHSLR